MRIARISGFLLLGLALGATVAIPSDRTLELSVSDFDHKAPPPFPGGFHERPVLLVDEKPLAITEEPKYRGKRQQYGSLDLGNYHERTFHFAVDFLDDDNYAVYFDSNRDGKLTDKSNPLRNTITPNFPIPASFTTIVKIQWWDLFDRTSLKGNYRLRLILQPELDSDAVGYMHYSITGLSTAVKIGDEERTVYLIDTPPNDADYTNDGITFDLNGDGWINPEREFALREFELAGEQYRVEVGW